MRSIIRFAFAVIIALAPLCGQAAEKPFFRMGVGSSSTETGPTDPAGDALAFVRTDSLPATLTTGQQASATFTSRGGDGEHSLQAFGFPPGLTLKDLGNKTWEVSGTASATGLYSPVVILSDAVTSVSHQLSDVSVLGAPASNAPVISAWSSGASTYAMPPYLPVGQDLENLDDLVYYAVKGGAAPYSVSIENGPPGVSFIDSGYQDAKGRVFYATGVVSAAAAYPSMRIVATDQASKRGEIAAPLSVVEGTVPLYFQSVNDPTKVALLPNEEWSGFYVIGGGQQPYSLSLVGANAPTPEVTEDGYGTGLGVYAAFPAGGTYPGLKVRVTDASGAAPIEHALPTFTVTAPEALRFTSTSNLPTVVYAGQNYGANDSLPITIAGFGNKSRDVEIVEGSAPEGFYIIPVSYALGQYAIYGKPSSFGTFPSVKVRAYTLASNGTEDASVEYTMPVSVRASAANGPSQSAPDLDFSPAASFPATARKNSQISTNVGATGGQGTYSLQVTGLPTGVSVNQTSPSTWTISGTATQVGEFTPELKLSSSGADAGDGSGPQGGGDIDHKPGPINVYDAEEVITTTHYFWQIPQTLPVGQDVTDEQVHFGITGGVAPYSVSYDTDPDGTPRAPVGFTYRLDYYETNGAVAWIEGAATQPGYFASVRIKVTDANGNVGFYQPGQTMTVVGGTGAGG